MKKAVFIDFYGTLVHEDGEIIKKISKIILETGNAESAGEIGGFWWEEFRKLFTGSYGDNFRTQREGDSLSSDIKGAAAVDIDAVWINRKGKNAPEGVTAVGSLTELFDSGLL